MKAAGCHLVALGVESGSNRVLRAIHKGATAERGEQTLAACRKLGLPALTYWVFGLPGETPETIEETLAYVDRTAPDYAHFYTPTPLPGSRLFDQLGIGARVEAGELAWSDFFQGVSAQFVAPGVTVDQVSRAVRRAYWHFYTSPRRLLREGMRLRTWGGLRGRLGTVYNMVRNYVLDKE
jgi:coproporphyrinogen III oxidase-like Fe-S oxidoreductase